MKHKLKDEKKLLEGLEIFRKNKILTTHHTVHDSNTNKSDSFVFEKKQKVYFSDERK